MRFLRQLDYHAQIINSGRFVNDSMGAYIAKQTVKKIIAADKNIKNARILIMGATFKENVCDIRNSKVVDIVKELISFGVTVDVTDPYADPLEIKNEYGFDMKKENGENYDVVIVAVNHEQYVNLSEDYFKSICSKDAILFDIKGIFRNKINKMTYWSL